ncbi:GNAT family N-acetyltransferase [Undibacterium sp. JH2W]|uniref:GNAT family N-acetyltransferase n=1 Tax=Undibacterium sp. JH2W TaxID=3413037 RepID=UPI003BF034F7
MTTFVTALEAVHDVRSFNCGNEVLNTWVQQIAKQHKKNLISQTFVIVHEDKPQVVLGFYSLAIRALISRDTLPPSMAKKLPANVPAITLGRLAVEESQQGRGYGEELLLDAMSRAKSAAEAVGGWALFVDAKDEKAAAFYLRYGFVAMPSNPLSLLIPIAHIP